MDQEGSAYFGALADVTCKGHTDTMNLPSRLLVAAMEETWVRSLGWEDPLEKGKAIHSSILAWRIPWTV